MTETTALVTLNHLFKIARGSIGKPLPGREVKIGADGEILVRGGSIAAQEWRTAALTSRARDGVGWQRATGRLGMNAGGSWYSPGARATSSSPPTGEHSSPGSGRRAAPAARVTEMR